MTSTLAFAETFLVANGEKMTGGGGGQKRKIAEARGTMGRALATLHLRTFLCQSSFACSNYKVKEASAEEKRSTHIRLRENDIFIKLFIHLQSVISVIY